MQRFSASPCDLGIEVLCYWIDFKFDLWYLSRSAGLAVTKLLSSQMLFLSFHIIFSSFHELMQSRGVRRPSVRPSVRLCANRYFYHRSGWIATKLAHARWFTWACIQGVLKVKVKVKGHVIRALLRCHEMFTIQHLLTFCLSSLHALTLRSTVTLSFQYKCQTARCNVYIMEWATPSLTVWFTV